MKPQRPRIRLLVTSGLSPQNTFISHNATFLENPHKCSRLSNSMPSICKAGFLYCRICNHRGYFFRNVPLEPQKTLNQNIKPRPMFKPQPPSLMHQWQHIFYQRAIVVFCISFCFPESKRNPHLVFPLAPLMSESMLLLNKVTKGLPRASVLGKKWVCHLK